MAVRTENLIWVKMAALPLLFLNETKVQAPDKSGFLQKNSKRNSFYFRSQAIDGGLLSYGPDTIDL